LTTPEYLTVVTEFLIQHCSRPVVNLQTRVKSLKIVGSDNLTGVTSIVSSHWFD